MVEDNMLDFFGKKSLTLTVLELWLGREVEENEALLLEEAMTLVVDHGPDSPSAGATITAAKEGKNLLRSVEAGLHEINHKHGGAIEACARLVQQVDFNAKKIVSDALSKGERIPGLGHRLYKDQDPRAIYLFSRAEQLGLGQTFIQRVRGLEHELEQQKGQKLVINVDGAMAAVLSELGVAPEMCNAFFLWPRVAGLVYRWELTRNENH